MPFGNVQKPFVTTEKAICNHQKAIWKNGIFVFLTPAFTISRAHAYPKPYLAVDTEVHRAVHSSEFKNPNPAKSLDPLSKLTPLKLSYHPKTR